MIETVSKKPIPPHVKAVVVEICVNDRDDEDVDVSSWPTNIHNLYLYR